MGFGWFLKALPDGYLDPTVHKRFFQKKVIFSFLLFFEKTVYGPLDPDTHREVLSKTIQTRWQTDVESRNRGGF